MFDGVKRFGIDAGFDGKSKLRETSFFAKLQGILSDNFLVKGFHNFLLKNAVLENYGILIFACTMEYRNTFALRYRQKRALLYFSFVVKNVVRA